MIPTVYTYKEIAAKILYIRHIQLIEDPYPELSQEKAYVKFFRFGEVKMPKGYPNPWKAHREGYNKAYKEIEEYFKKNIDNPTSPEEPIKVPSDKMIKYLKEI